MTPDPQRPSSWKPYRKGLCDDCSAGCCTLPVEVSASDLIRLGLTNEEECSVSLKALSKRLLKDKTIQSYHSKTGIFILAQIRGNDCLYLGVDRRCTVYEKRPEVCRNFPKIGPKPGFCPAKKK